MEKPKILFGHAIVAKGVTRFDASLPEIGLKDIVPNGSWLEQKQIQAALESRKHLIEVERIEKFGTLSHAIWRDDLRLAEVTHKTGGQWQYLGHNNGKTLYLRPEEALFLIEVNCLLLKHNDMIVSLQKAYSLLLKDITITQYRVYASLSRLGYKILRHKCPKVITKPNSTSIMKSSEQLIIDKINVQDVIDAPTDSSLPIEDNKNVNIISIPTKDNTIPCTENDNRIEENKIIETNNTKTELHELNTVVIKHVEVDTIKMNIEEANEQNIDTKDNKIQTFESENNLTANAENKIETSIVMEVDVPNVKMECNKIVNAGEIKTESHPESAIENSTIGNVSNLADAENINKMREETAAQEDELPNMNHENSDPPNIAEFQPPDIIADVSIEENGTNVQSTLAIEVDSADSDPVMDLDTPKSKDITVTNIDPVQEIINDSKTDPNTSDILVTRKEHVFLNYVSTLIKKLTEQIKPSNCDTITKHFENIPDMFKKEVVTINAPNPDYIPKNIYVNNTSYVLNIQQIKNTRPSSVESPIYNSTGNSNHIRRIRSNSSTEFNQNLQFVNNVRFPPRQTLYFRPYNFWRPQNNLNYVSFNMFFQRPYFPNMYYQSHARPSLRPISFPNNLNTNMNRFNSNINHRKRLRSAKATHLQRIKNLAVRLKQLLMSGHTHVQNIESLHKLLLAFNNRYKSRLRLNKNFDVVNDENIVDTIELDTDDDSRTKKPRLSQDDCDKFDENLHKLRQLALKFRDLETKNKSTSKHKRALSKSIKTFNKSYDADIYMNKNYEIIDKRFITIDSDSETDCIVNEPNTHQEPVPKRKKLRNPFYILKQSSENQNDAIPSTSKENKIDELVTQPNIECITNNKCRENITNTFGENWLPNENDFGTAEVIKTNNLRLQIEAIKHEYLYSFITNHFEDLNNWLDAKIAFLQHIESDVVFQTEDNEINTLNQIVEHSGLQPLIHAEDCLDTVAILEKLRIVKNNKAIDSETCLCIHFDVYNRDVQNFRKTNPPKPHFRIICMDESSNFPSAADVMALNLKYEDSVPVVFAIVGLSSISYLQINPIDLPVYTANSELG